MKKKTQEKILQKSQKLMTQSVRVNMLNQYERVFSLEYGIDAKAFCNYFKAYYQGGDLTTCCRLIRQKHCSLMGQVKLTIPTKNDPKNCIKIQINSQNDLKRNFGINSLKFTHQCRINHWITMKNFIRKIVLPRPVFEVFDRESYFESSLVEVNSILAVIITANEVFRHIRVLS